MAGRFPRLVAIVLFWCLCACGHGGSQTGGLDESFGRAGMVTIDFGPTRFDFSTGVAVQPDGKMVVGATSCDSSPPYCAFALARCESDGRLDATFGSGGLVLTNLQGAEAHALALQPDGKIVLAGLAAGDASATTSTFALVRYDSRGNLDPTFGSAGVVLTRIAFPAPDGTTTEAEGAQFNGLALQPDGKIIAVGTLIGPVVNSNVLLVARYDVDGTLDASFGDNGVAFVILDGPTNGTAVVRQRSGRIVVTGDVSDGTNEAQLLLAGFDTAGQLDPSFGDHGIVRTALPGPGNSLAETPDDGLVVGSLTGVRRYNQSGQLYPSFDDHDATDAIAITSVAVQADGKILVTGPAFVPHDTSDGFGVARLHAEGSLDKSFGHDGLSITRLGFITDDAESVLAIQPDGNLAVAAVLPLERADLLVLRYLNAP